MRHIVLLLSVLAAPIAARAQQLPHDSLQGAVRVLNARARTLEVTTGVGMALQVVRLQVPSDARITTRGAALAFSALQPGDIVRVSFGARPTGGVAYTIERVGRMATGPEPSQ